MNKNSKIIGHVLCLVCVLVWGSATVSSRIALNVLSPEELLLLRFLIGYIFLWVISPNFVKLDCIFTRGINSAEDNWWCYCNYWVNDIAKSIINNRSRTS